MNAISRAQRAAATRSDPRWASVLARDPQADGRFYYSVKTSGVYCRPSCAARPALPENVAFHRTMQAAEQAGFRPCKRCKPDRPVLAIRFAIGASTLGALLVARSERGVCAILPGDDADALAQQLRERFPDATLIRDQSGLAGLLMQIVDFIGHPQRDLDLPLDARGSDFQQRVWQALRSIPAGATASYADIAQRIGSPRSVRAVAAACAANPLAVAIPCHRVVKSDGALSGYRWGVERKRALLAREAQA